MYTLAQVPVWIESGVMRLPAASTPMTMVGPGTGVAPFRAMLEERGLQMSQGRLAYLGGQCGMHVAAHADGSVLITGYSLNSVAGCAGISG